MNKIIERIGKWGTNNVRDNNITIMNDYCIVIMKDEFPHTYNDFDDNFLSKVRKLVDDVAEYDKELEVPTVKEIKTAISVLCGRKYSQRVLYCFGKDLPTVNARFMLDIIDNLKVNEIMYGGQKKPLYFKGEYGNAILLPMCSYNCSYNIDKGYRLG